MNKLMKRLVRIGIAGALIGSLAACGNKESTTDAITFALWGSSPAEVAAMDNTIASFTEATGIEVKKEVIEDKYMDVLKSRFAANTAPDVFYVDAFEAPGLIKSGVLADQTTSIEDADDFYPQFLDAFKDTEGKIFGAPKDYSTLSLYVNETMFTDAGVQVSDVPTDFVGFLDFAKELQEKLPENTAALVAEKDLARHLSALEATGAEVIKSDGTADFGSNPAVSEYLQKFATGHAEGYIFDAKTDLGADWAGAAFGTNKAAMMLEGNWVLSALEADFGDVAYTSYELPTVNDKKHTMAFTVGYAISKDTKKSENAQIFVNYMTSVGQAQWSRESGTLPTRKSVTEEMKLAKNPNLTSHIIGAEYATVWARGETLPIINTNFGNQFLAAFNGQEDVATAIKNIDTISNEEIEKQA